MQTAVKDRYGCLVCRHASFAGFRYWCAIHCFEALQRDGDSIASERQCQEWERDPDIHVLEEDLDRVPLGTVLMTNEIDNQRKETQ